MGGLSDMFSSPYIFGSSAVCFVALDLLAALPRGVMNSRRFIRSPHRAWRHSHEIMEYRRACRLHAADWSSKLSSDSTLRGSFPARSINSSTLQSYDAWLVSRPN